MFGYFKNESKIDKGVINTFKKKKLCLFKIKFLQQNGALTSKEHEPVEREPKIFIDCEDKEVILSKKVRIIDTFFVNEISIEKISHTVAKDGFTFNSFCTSSDLRYLFSKSGFRHLISPNTIRSMVVKFLDSVKADIMKKFTSLKKPKPKVFDNIRRMDVAK